MGWSAGGAVGQNSSSEAHHREPGVVPNCAAHLRVVFAEWYLGCKDSLRRANGAPLQPPRHSAGRYIATGGSAGNNSISDRVRVTTRR